MSRLSPTDTTGARRNRRRKHVAAAVFYRAGAVQMLSTRTAILKYSSTEQASTIVVMMGDAMMAGSSLSFFAVMGRIQPSSFAMITAPIRLRPVTRPIAAFWYMT